MDDLILNLKQMHRTHSYKGLSQHIGVAPNTVRRWLTNRSHPSKLAQARVVKALRRLSGLTHVHKKHEDITSTIPPQA